MYRIIKVEDEMLKELCLLYCDSKSFLWNLFCGWRKTHKDTYYFRLSETQWVRILETEMKIIDYIKRENTLDERE